ncbi:MAG: aspartate kinase [Thermoguttaceae bacterium]|nr:aspartate kinase [Thermoguttaceae bacterium]
MSILVQKFGGTSVADSEKILAAARKAIRAQKEGHQVVTVVSAMGHTTDVLVDLAKQITDEPPAREMDMLLATGEQVSVALMAMAIHSLGHQAISMTGAQMGIVTDRTHTKARIRSITAGRIREALDGGKIVIAAGFQGITEEQDITTLGRGGSDTTAVALAAALGAEACEIYTDVDGIYTTDPRLVPEARRLKQISYDEMLELASAGAGVMHNRSIEFAKKFNVPVHVRSSFSDMTGTMIVADPEAPDQPVCGAALVKNEARVTVLGVPDRPGAAMGVFQKVADRNIAVDMIVQNVAEDGRADISFTVSRDELPTTLKAVDQAVKELGAAGYTYDDDVSKVSIVGLGMATQPGVADKMFRALAEKGINILMITTSEIKISVVVERSHGVEALRTVHETFGLDQVPAKVAEPSGQPTRAASTDELVKRLRGMESLFISGITLDESQARVTLKGIPDTPGLAAQVFDEVAENGVVVDMIVQSVGSEGRANISFTVPAADLAKSLAVAERIAEGLSGPRPTNSPRVAKLSVSGIGMRTHIAVASRLFQSLAKAGINIEMINTSEMLVNVVVAGDKGQQALEALRNEFADVMLD